ncbi:MAG TPA: ATP-binding cassette domain-containing protein [Acidimicrobiales bacterium]|nr:ATP-binding cassette domain-containing protein [Acidimicrobiales bacterium]
MSFLEVQDLDAAYGQVQILFGLSLEIEEGEIVALLGTNGAGKSTLFKCITGLLPAARGKVIFDGTDVTSMATNDIADRGIVMMPGGRSVFPTLTVLENLGLASWLKRKDKSAVRDAEERVLSLFPRLRERTTTMAGNLSGGEQQMLAIAQALIPDPKLLLIDELSLGLAPTIVGQLIDVVHQIHETGLTVVVVEQSVNVALKLAERAVFMEKGEFRFSGATKELLDRPDILRSVFIQGANAGGPPSTPAPAAAATRQGRRPLRKKVEPEPLRTPPPADAAVILECVGVTKRFGGITAVDEVDLELREGQILGLIGQNGAGKTTLFDCVSGFLRVDGGRIELLGEDITDLTPDQRAAQGLGRSFQEARLFPSLTTAETLAIARERQLLTRSMVAAALGQPVSIDSEEDTATKVDMLIELMGLDAFREKLTGELSTGTRRIVEIACLLAADPKVIVLDEPSGGVAQKETEALGPLLQRLQAYTGTSILVIEHDMPLLSSICDEMYALELGSVIARGTPAEVLDHPRVIESYLGTDATAVNRSGALV